MQKKSFKNTSQRTVQMTKVITLGIFFIFSARFTHAQVLLPDSLKTWMEYEAKLNDKGGYNIPSRDNSILEKKFRAESEEWFEVKSYWVPESELNVAIDSEILPLKLERELVRRVNGSREYRLFVHPKSANFYKKLTDKCASGETVKAQATASSRTVLMRLEEADLFIFAKLSLDVNLGDVVRTIPQGEVARSVGVSKYVNNRSETLGDSFRFLPEPLGISPKGWLRGGQIIRTIPEDIIYGKTKIIPLFSLTATRPAGTILEDMVRRSGQNPYRFVRDFILRPFLKSWIKWAVEGPITMEAHSQNVLMELDDNGLPTGVFIHRDMGGMSLDMESSRFSLQEKRNLPWFTSLDEDYHQKFTEVAKYQSLVVYFQQRFLYNVDRELHRLDRRYKPEKILKDVFVLFSELLSDYSGLESVSLDPDELRDDIPYFLMLASESRDTQLCKNILIK